jgi:hypothetical protein
VPFLTVRVQLWLSVDDFEGQLPPAQVGVVAERVWVPIVSQVLAKPPHALQAP